jgi:hypothetical protein
LAGSSPYLHFPAPAGHTSQKADCPDRTKKLMADTHPPN